MIKMKFKKRIRGTPRQIGKPFPVLVKKKLPKVVYPTSRRRGGKVVEIGGQQYYASENGGAGGTAYIPVGGKVNEIQMKSLRSPYTGAPLEPAPEYGSSIMYDPYSGEFVMVSVPEARIAAGRGGGKEPYVVKPRFTVVDEESLRIAKNYLTQASAEVERDPTNSGLKRAYRILDDAQRVEPWHKYPEAGLQKHPIYTELKQASTYVGNMVDSAAESGGGEKAGFVQKGIDRILTAKKALVGD